MECTGFVQRLCFELLLDSHVTDIREIQNPIKGDHAGYLNAGLQRIGEKLGFEGRLKIEGLPTLADVDRATEHLNSGVMPFTEVMKPFELN